MPICLALRRLARAMLATSSAVLGAWHALCAGRMLDSSSAPPKPTGMTCSTSQPLPAIFCSQMWQTPPAASKMRRRRVGEMWARFTTQGLVFDPAQPLGRVLTLATDVVDAGAEADGLVRVVLAQVFQHVALLD